MKIMSTNSLKLFLYCFAFSMLRPFLKVLLIDLFFGVVLSLVDFSMKLLLFFCVVYPSHWNIIFKRMQKLSLRFFWFFPHMCFVNFMCISL